MEMNEDRIGINEWKNFRIKRKNNVRSDNPIEEISNRIHSVIEEIAQRNKRFKPDCSTTFQSDFFTIEDNIKEKKIIFNIINPNININIRLNNPPSIVNNNYNTPNYNNNLTDNSTLRKLNNESSLGINNNRNDNNIQQNSLINNTLFADKKKEEEKKSENLGLFPKGSSLFESNKLPQEIPSSTGTHLFQSGNLFGNDGNKIFQSGSLFGNLSNNLTSIPSINQNTLFNINTQPKQDVKTQENKLIPLTNLTNIINNNYSNPINNGNVNQFPSNVQIQMNLPNNNNALQNNTNPTKKDTNTTVVESNTKVSNEALTVITPQKAFQKKLVLMGENYNKIKAEVEKISKMERYTQGINKIIDKINLKFNQISTDDSINQVVNETLSILRDLEASNQDDLYIYTIDYICKRVITKAEGYYNDAKTNIHRLSKIVSSLDQNVPIFGDFFISIVSFRCPFIIPKVFSKKDCNNDVDYGKKMGFAYHNQTATEHLADMESHSYLFFGFIQQDKNRKYSKYVQYFTQNLFTESCIYPVAAIVNAFLDIFGNTFKQTYELLFNEFVLKLPDWLKVMEITKNNCKSADIKSKVNTHIHFIKKNIDVIKKNLPTVMHK